MYIRMENMLHDLFKHFAIKSSFFKIEGCPNYTQYGNLTILTISPRFYVKTILVSLESQNLTFWQSQRQWLTILANLSNFQNWISPKSKFWGFENFDFVELKSLKIARICRNFQSLPLKLSKYQFLRFLIYHNCFHVKS